MSSATIPRLPILVAPQPILKTRARPVAPGDADTVRALVPKMFATMYDAPGIGLAAPQVGVGLRLAVIDPSIVSTSAETAVREEGCLSLPGMYADVARPAVVTVRYQDQAGAKHEVTADGLLAACLQHELDHLDGVLFVDHLSALKRNMILRRLAKEMRQKREEASR
jgi:peptide deformylase